MGRAGFAPRLRATWPGCVLEGGVSASDQRWPESDGTFYPGPGFAQAASADDHQVVQVGVKPVVPPQRLEEPAASSACSSSLVATRRGRSRWP